MTKNKEELKIKFELDGIIDTILIVKYFGKIESIVRYYIDLIPKTIHEVILSIRNKNNSDSAIILYREKENKCLLTYRHPKLIITRYNDNIVRSDTVIILNNTERNNLMIVLEKLIL